MKFEVILNDYLVIHDVGGIKQEVYKEQSNINFSDPTITKSEQEIALLLHGYYTQIHLGP